MSEPTWQVEVHGQSFALRYMVEGATIKFEVHLIAGVDGNGLVYADERHNDSLKNFDPPSYKPVEDGHLMHGFLKFDGCVHIQQSRTDCGMHFCDFHGRDPIGAQIMRAIAALGPKMGDAWMYQEVEDEVTRLSREVVRLRDLITEWNRADRRHARACLCGENDAIKKSVDAYNAAKGHLLSAVGLSDEDPLYAEINEGGCEHKRELMRLYRSVDSGDHYCERCHGFAQHCPALPIEQRLVIARKAVETAKKVLEARKRETALYDHEEEMLENAELWLSEVEAEAKESGSAPAGDERPKQEEHTEC